MISLSAISVCNWHSHCGLRFQRFRGSEMELFNPPLCAHSAVRSVMHEVRGTHLCEASSKPSVNARIWRREEYRLCGPHRGVVWRQHRQCSPQTNGRTTHGTSGVRGFNSKGLYCGAQRQFFAKVPDVRVRCGRPVVGEGEGLQAPGVLCQGPCEGGGLLWYNYSEEPWILWVQCNE